MDLGEVSLNNDRLAAQVDLFQAALEVDERSALPLPYSPVPFPPSSSVPAPYYVKLWLHVK